MKTISHICFTLLSAAMLASNGFAIDIAINSSNFSRTDGGSPVSNTYTAANHVGLEYIGGTDFLNSDQTFTITYDYTGGANPVGGAAIWFGTVSNADWVFANEQNGAPDDLLRNFVGRNLVTNSGGSVSDTDTIPDGDMMPSSNIIISIDRTFLGGNYFLDVELRNASDTVIGSLSNINVGTDASWGVTMWAPAASGDVSNTTTTISNLSVTAIPEPGTYVALAGLLAFLVALKRRQI